VAEPELLEYDDTLSGSPKRFTGGQAHHPCSDNDDLCVAHGPYPGYRARATGYMLGGHHTLRLRAR
jgi:hypothetical protein